MQQIVDLVEPITHPFMKPVEEKQLSPVVETEPMIVDSASPEKI
jgi:hypothetical protein